MLENDSPIKVAKEDQLGMDYPSNELAEILLNYKSTNSLVVGVYGEWGSGKSSFINLLRSKIEHNLSNDPIMINFDPWFCNSEDELLSYFYDILSTNIKKAPSIDKKILRNLFKYFNKISPIITNKKLVGCLLVLGNFFLREKSSEELKNEINKILENTKDKIYIFIDDLDRLPDNQIRLIFKLVNHIANFQNIIYIIPFDYDVVTKALDKIQIDKGANYLQKIIQLPYNVPKPGQEIVIKIFFEKFAPYMDNVPEKNIDKRRVFRLQSTFVQTYIHTIRDVKLLLNTFSINKLTLSNELDVLDLLALSFLKVFNQPLYEWIYNNKKTLFDTILGYNAKECRNTLSNLLITEEVCSEKNVEKTIDLLSELFPKFNVDTSLSDDKENRRLHRIACKDYFYQYFSGNYPLTYINRKKINDISNTDNCYIVKQIIEDSIDKEALSILLSEIESNINYIQLDSLKILAEQLIFTFGKSKENDNNLYNQLPVDESMSYVLADILKKIGADESINTSSNLVINSLKIADFDNILGISFWLDHEEQIHTRSVSDSIDRKSQSVDSQALKKIESIYCDRLKMFLEKINLLHKDIDLYLPMYLWSQFDLMNYKNFWLKKFSEDSLYYIIFLNTVNWEYEKCEKVISFSEIKNHILILKDSNEIKKLPDNLIDKATKFTEDYNTEWYYQ